VLVLLSHAGVGLEKEVLMVSLEVFDVGEEPAEEYTWYMTSNISFFQGYLKEFGALGIVWEHR